MAYETKNNSGSLFKNERKEEPSHADYQGTCVVDGKEMWINAWVKTKKDGQKYFSVSFRDKKAKGSSGGSARRAGPNTAVDDIDDGIPF